MKPQNIVVSSIIAACVGVVFAGQAYAQIAVEVTGNQRIETSTVMSYMGLNNASDVSQSQLNEGVKRLYSTGLFADVEVKQESESQVRIELQENPVIRKIAFEGNRRLENDDLAEGSVLRERSVYTRGKVQQSVERLKAIYEKSGRYNTEVVPKIIPLEQNRVDLVFEIDEGKATKVTKVYFNGNNVYSTNKLRKVIKTEKTSWYKFFSNDDTYDGDRLEYDKELLRRHYAGNGYAEFRVDDTLVELTPDNEGFLVTFTITEGPQYRYGDLVVNSSIADVSGEELLGNLPLKSGDVFDAQAVEDAVETLTEKLGDLGYAFVRIAPELKPQADARLMDVTYVLSEGPRVYVERINIIGNVRTLDKVVRREFRFSEGDPFSTSALKRSEQRINNLGYFETVTITTEQGSAPDKAVINVEVVEQSTGELTLGAGFSTQDGALADIGVQENNLLGAGKQLRANLTLATERQQAQIGYTEPYFLGKDIQAGFDLFNTRQDFQTESSFEREVKGGTLRASYALTEHLRHSVSYTYRMDEVTNVAATASRFIRDQEGDYSTSSIGQVLTWDRRDSRFEASDGFFVRLSQDLAGLGGDASYVRHELRGAYYYSVMPQWVLSAGANMGYVLGMGEDVRINDRFFVGSRRIRGFRRSGIGPRDLTTGDALGGNAYYTSSLELGFPLNFASDDGAFRGALFMDVGSLWDAENSAGNVADQNAMRMSAGVGVSWRSPFGPIRLDFGHAILDEEYDQTELIRINFGTRF